MLFALFVSILFALFVVSVVWVVVVVVVSVAAVAVVVVAVVVSVVSYDIVKRTPPKQPVFANTLMSSGDIPIYDSSNFQTDKKPLRLPK